MVEDVEGVRGGGGGGHNTTTIRHNNDKNEHRTHKLNRKVTAKSTMDTVRRGREFRRRAETAKRR